MLPAAPVTATRIGSFFIKRFSLKESLLFQLFHDDVSNFLN